MPSSRPNIIPTVVHLVRQFRPHSILDVGVGFGKWGHLFREYTDIVAAEHDPARYDKKNWQVRIDGIEGHPPYLTPMHHYLYDKIHLGDAISLIKTLPNYDLIFLGDVLEHFEKPQGLQMLRDARAKADKAVIVSTPKYETAQEDLCGNELERHRSLWSATDLRAAGATQTKTIDGDVLLAVFLPPGTPKLEFRRNQHKPDVSRSSQTREAIRKLLPPNVPFILVDEEQLRSSLRMANALPFLEKEGNYWGAPEKDATAIAELERMRQNGAQFVVFISSTFWWLEHYKVFQQHLQSRYLCVQKDENIIAFDLSVSPPPLTPK
jgi:hypothetical protein